MHEGPLPIPREDASTATQIGFASAARIQQDSSTPSQKTESTNVRARVALSSSSGVFTEIETARTMDSFITQDLVPIATYGLSIFDA